MIMEYKFIIKDFDEPHQEEISQLIFDSIIAQRTSTRIHDACYFISNKVNCKNRNNKRVFIISNVIDQKLKIGKNGHQFSKIKMKNFAFILSSLI